MFTFVCACLYIPVYICGIYMYLSFCTYHAVDLNIIFILYIIYISSNHFQKSQYIRTIFKISQHIRTISQFLGTFELAS